MTTHVIRFQKNGPGNAGLTALPVDPAHYLGPAPEQNAHLYFEDEALGLTAGIWDTTGMQEPVGPYPGDEFIFLIEGEFAMADASGHAIPARAGQSAIFRNGAPMGWVQEGYLRKFFLLLNDPAEADRAHDSAEGGFIVLDPDMTLTDDDPITQSDSGAKQRERVLFSGDTGKFTVGLWDTEALVTEPYPFPEHELAQVLEGEVTITHADGTAETFTAGDVFFIPAGTVTKWEVPRYLRKFYACVPPAE